MDLGRDTRRTSRNESRWCSHWHWPAWAGVAGNESFFQRPAPATRQHDAVGPLDLPASQPHIAPMSNSSDTLFEFPCDFPLKVMGRHTDDFRSIVLGIVQKHAGPILPTNIEERPSRDGTYLSLTCTFNAQSKQQLDDLYRELTAHERVMIVL